MTDTALYNEYCHQGGMGTIEDYRTVTGTFEDEMSLKGSRFIGIVMPCPSESDISASIETVMKKYPNATHYCYAALFNGSEKRERSSDNGEPSGTAGKPILNVLKGSGLSDLICIVVRYFGGTLLGTGGLVHAYSETSKLVMQSVTERMRYACSFFKFTLDYQYYSIFESKCRSLMAVKPECDYYEKVDVRAWIRIPDTEEFVRRITDVTERHVILYRGNDTYLDNIIVR